MGSLEAEAAQASPAQVDFVKGNVKARARMMAQYALANFANGLVVGTDHAAEALMGFSPSSVTAPATWRPCRA